MGLMEELLALIGSGSIGGLPPLALMAFPFVIGLVSYFGFLGLSFGSLKDLAVKYGPLTFQYAALLLGILPLSIGLIIGLVIGFLFG
jgi:hypothetical protein